MGVGFGYADFKIILCVKRHGGSNGHLERCQRITIGKRHLFRDSAVFGDGDLLDGHGEFPTAIAAMQCYGEFRRGFAQHLISLGGETHVIATGLCSGRVAVVVAARCKHGGQQSRSH